MTPAEQRAAAEVKQSLNGWIVEWKVDDIPYTIHGEWAARSSAEVIAEKFNAALAGAVSQAVKELIECGDRRHARQAEEIARLHRVLEVEQEGHAEDKVQAVQAAVAAERERWNRDKPIDDAPACVGCGGPHPFDTSLPSESWNRVIRAGGLPDYLCTTCIVRAFVKAGEGFTAALWGEEFHGQQIEVALRAAGRPDGGRG